MSEQLLEKLAPRLKKLGQGGYVRGYRGKRSLRNRSTQQLIGELLDSLKIPYKEHVRVPGTALAADFFVNGTSVFVDRDITEAEMKLLTRSKQSCVMIRRYSIRSDRFDHGIRVLGLEQGGEHQTIFLDDPSFSFDYAHILPKTEKCSVMHGHTSSVLVEVIGRPIDGMVVDFGIAKPIVRDAVRDLDHKLFISEKYVTKMDGKSVALMFDTVHGEFAIKAPKATTVLMGGEATVENLAREVLARIAPKMPANVTAVGVFVYEGMNKGSHVLAKIHADGAHPRRRNR